MLRRSAAFYAALLAGSGNEIARRILETLDARIAYLRHLTTQRAPQPRQLRTVALLRGIFSAVQRARARRRRPALRSLRRRDRRGSRWTCCRTAA